MDKIILSEKQINDILPKLQQILRIQDWDITVEVLNDEEFKNLYERSEQGHNQVTRLLNASYIAINKDVSEDCYKTLMHELFHLVFDHLETCETLIYQINNKQVQESVDDVFRVALERTVERMAQIFILIYPLDKLLIAR